MSQKNKSNGIDFVTPFAEIFHELVVHSGKLIVLGSKKAYQKWNKNYFEVTKIEERHLYKNKKTTSPISLGYSSNKNQELNLDEIDFSKHSFIVGAAGFGKTNLISILQEYSLQKGRPIIFIDPKGDLEALETFKALCKKYNRKCYIFSEHYRESIKLNPFREGSINQVTDRIISALEWSEQFYKNVSAEALSKALRKLQDMKKPYSLSNICDVLEESFNTKETLGLRVQLNQIRESDFGKILEEDDKTKDFLQIREDEACLYIGLSTQGYGETAYALGKIFLGELLYSSYFRLKSSVDSHKSMDESIAVFFDEFGAVVTPRFIELQNKCRGAGIQLFMAVQSASDIDRIDPNLTQQILENSSNLFILKQRMEYGATLFATAIGTKLTQKVTNQTENGSSNGLGTIREAQELLVHPDIIKNLRVGQCVLLRHNPTRLDLVNLRERVIKIEKKQEVKSSIEPKKEALANQKLIFELKQTVAAKDKSKCFEGLNGNA